ncbi:MAG: PorT family protein [Prevotella sp.]|nr:PorT family protein [Prevotella sp.]
MKKLFVLVVMTLFVSLTMKGQESVGTFSLIPKIGVSIANVSGEKIYYENSEIPAKGKYNARFLGGVEAEYQMLPTTSVSLGVGYVQQGCRFSDLEIGNPQTISEGLDDVRSKLDYIQCPLTVNQYLTDGLAVKAGIQLGFLVNSEFSFSLTPIKHFTDGSKEYGKTEDIEIDQKSVMRSVDISIPVGLSYEYLNVVLDARYHFGLTNLYKDKSWPTEKNKVFTLTVGYKFNL